MSSYIDRTMQAFPAEFFKSLIENTDTSFAEAATLAKRHVDEPERANMLGQLRHARLEAGFREAAQSHKLTVAAPHTEPRGGRYSLVSANSVYIIRSNVQAHCGTPRPTNFRVRWSELNRWLSPQQLNLLYPTVAPPSNHLCGMLVVTAPRRGDLSVPAFVGLGFPRHDLSDWIELLPLTKLLALYHDVDMRQRIQEEAPVEVKDTAVPRLKKRPDNAG